jgi:class 3 adenylate cyclase
MVGYSRLASTDEGRTLARLRALLGDLVEPAIAADHGRIVKRTGEGIAECEHALALDRNLADAHTFIGLPTRGPPPPLRG